jgi:hypothetical protein
MKIIISFLLLLSYYSTYAHTSIEASPIPPVELTSFAVQLEDSYVHLFWTTAIELNNRGFAVERAIKLGQWHEIGFVEGKGTTIEPKKYEFIDALINNVAEKYYYRLKQIDYDGTFNYSEEIEISLNPIIVTLFANYPNPFNPSTKIRFVIPKSSFVSLKVYNVLGKEAATLVNEERPAGSYEVEFDALSLPSGVYFYQLRAGNYIETKKMILLR